MPKINPSFINLEEPEQLNIAGNIYGENIAPIYTDNPGYQFVFYGTCLYKQQTDLLIYRS